jgi:hypothetical protein
MITLPHSVELQAFGDFRYWTFATQIDVSSHVGDWGLSRHGGDIAKTTLMTRSRI